jgi:cardiolipin synthase
LGRARARDLNVEPLTPAATAAPNAFVLCPNADAFLDALRRESRRCHRTLFVQFSTFEGDASGEALSEILLERAAAGVDVRFLVDHYSDVIANDILPTVFHRRHELREERARTTALLAHLQSGGVAVRRTAPVGRWWQYFMYRDHRKLVVVDGRVGFVGGLNVSDHNFTWRDFMVQITGPIVTDLATAFTATWTGVPLDGVPPRFQADFVVDDAPGRHAIAEEVLALVDGATRSIVCESPSLLGDRLEAALVRAADRGVHVTVIAPARHNRAIFRLWVAETFRRLQHPNITVYRFEGSGGMTHAKLLLVDDTIATFGSSNFFALEAVAQRELNVFTSDPDCIGALRRFVADAIAHSSISKPPARPSFRWTYTLAERAAARWTRRLLRDADWGSRYA